MARRKKRWASLGANVVFATCDAFLRKMKPEQIQKLLLERFGERVAVNQVYQVVKEGFRRGFFQLTPPRDEGLSQRLEDLFVHAPRTQRPNLRMKAIRVVSTGFEAAPGLEYVARAAADTTFDLIVAAGRRRAEPGRARRGAGVVRPVHIGFGAGATTMLVARYLAERLRGMPSPPAIVLHALSSGFSVREPAFAPVAFFAFFYGIPGFESRGLFSAAYVGSEDWDKTRAHVGVQEAFAERGLLDIVVTSLASKEDEHGELNKFMKAYDQQATGKLGEESRDLLDLEQRVGDVMYRPFSRRGPITRNTKIRAVTLFELSELVTFAADPQREVVLVCGPCGSCGRSRDDALLPLLTVDSLAVWSHLITDDLTATKVLQAAAGPGSGTAWTAPLAMGATGGLDSGSGARP